MEEGGGFYVVRKGNTIAVYKNLSDCQAQVSSSVSNPAVSVYKGQSWSKETEESLISKGLKNPLYTIDASEMNDGLFGTLVPCSFQDVADSSISPNSDLKRKGRARDLSDFLGAKPNFHNSNAVGSASSLLVQNKKHCNVGNYQNAQQSFSNQDLQPLNSSQSLVAPNTNNALCILEFDGASKGNPGKAGAGAIIRTQDGKVICRLCEGLGVVTNNVAEYRSVILGLKYAIKKGFKRIEVKGDSNLVVMQVEGKWQCKHANMISLHKQVIELKSKFQSFKIQHVRREFNSDADHQANLAVELHEGQISEDHGDGL
ncbi:hypothetical protein LUZ60_015015 [Juncus effusus]|nr:hypothetical protein LUZ60_015015 [Juncus effusus]